ncbi:MAG TPA: YHYH domain-containing protein [Candidatus Paceibacterota bacterium]|nr:YHYH domain-containing protein [Candidatus Paceibacterota bacterium]
MKKIILILIILIPIIAPNISFAHPGRTDSSGCHTCRTNCSNWGLSAEEYHCHRSKGVNQPEEPIRSIRNENGVGTTVLAPEYKVPVANTIKTEPINANSTIKDIPTSVKKKSTIQETKKEEKPIIPPIINETPKSNIIPASKVTEVKKPTIIKRFFNWLF